MKTSVTFRSNQFPPYEGEEDLVNPALWGNRLAEYLVAKLNLMGIHTKDPIAEDWGWYIPIEIEGYTLAIGCGHQYGNDDEFLCFTEPDTPVIRKLFRKVDVSKQLGQLVEALQNILSSDSEIRDVEWTES